MTLQFISCSDTKCPLNESKQCRAPFITVDKNGKCFIREAGPYDNKSAVDTYVNIKKCDCTRCDQWEKDSFDEGTCGLRADLFFNAANICHEFEKQIGEPGFSAIV